MAHFVLPALMLGSVALLSCAVTYAGAGFTLNKIAEAAVSAPIKSNLKPNYVAVPPAADARSLDVARSVAVVVRGDPADALQPGRPAKAFTTRWRWSRSGFAAGRTRPCRRYLP